MLNLNKLVDESVFHRRRLRRQSACVETLVANQVKSDAYFLLEQRVKNYGR